MTISLDLKKRCVEATKTLTYWQTYTQVFLPEHEGMSFECFRHKLSAWRKKAFAEDDTLFSGTYADFTAKNATVQVDKDGNVVQAWIKQTASDTAYDALIEAVRNDTKPFEYLPEPTVQGERMLEIGLYDMHFGLPNDYSNVLNELLEVIQSKDYDEINIIIGQDMLHNDDFRGRTSKGTPIEHIDLAKAWNDAKDFWYTVILAVLNHCRVPKLTYVKGNHDESMSWAFVQMLKTKFPLLIVDDSMAKRKCIHWNGCFIGLSHGNESQSKPNDLRGMFTITFPNEFASSKVREIHCGHLHQEKEADSYGIMCRRLSTANVTDSWSDDNGYVGAQKRFMVFEWAKDRLKTINYLSL